MGKGESESGRASQRASGVLEERALWGGRGGLEANLEHITCTEGRSSRFSAEDGLRQQMQNRDKERPVDFRPCNFAKLCLIFNISPPQFNISPLSGND